MAKYVFEFEGKVLALVYSAEAVRVEELAGMPKLGVDGWRLAGGDEAAWGRLLWKRRDEGNLRGNEGRRVAQEEGS